VLHDGVRVTSPARTWLDLVSLMTVDDLIAVGDSLVCIRGMRTARLALPEIRVGADSPRETRMRLILARSGPGEPALNHVIVNAWGQPANTSATDT
jgi:hypothetical protein